MVTQKLQDSLAYAEQIQVIGRELKAQNRRWPTFAAVFLLLGGVALLVLMGKNFDFSDSCTRVDLGILLFILFILWEIRAYRKSKRLCNQLLRLAAAICAEKGVCRLCPADVRP